MLKRLSRFFIEYLLTFGLLSYLLVSGGIGLEKWQYWVIMFQALVWGAWRYFQGGLSVEDLYK